MSLARNRRLKCGKVSKVKLQDQRRRGTVLDIRVAGDGRGMDQSPLELRRRGKQAIELVQLGGGKGTGRRSEAQEKTRAHSVLGAATPDLLVLAAGME